jgi:hypothetical protein
MRTTAILITALLLLSANSFSQVATSGKSSIHLNTRKSIVATTPATQATQTGQPEAQGITRPPTEPLTNVGRYYALIIGVQDYSDPAITDLDNPIRDAELFYQTITSFYTFEKDDVRMLRNASMAEIVASLDYFAKIVKPTDNFLIFFAGHGVWNATAEVGYWLPADAQKNSTLNWFRNSTLRDFLREVPSKHTLLISDACFAGSIFKTRSAFADASRAINKLYELPSRKAITSGQLTQVPDRSAFLKFMIERLITNSERYLASEQLYSSFRLAVINNSNVIPQYGEIYDVGDQGGDFIFIKRQ